MNQVSELYLYNAMPFVSIVVGIGLGKLIHVHGGRRWKQLTAVGALIALAVNVAAIQEKASLMDRNGDRAATLLALIQPYLEDVPENGKLMLLNPSSAEPEYSVFLMNGFHVLDLAVHYIRFIGQRKDLRLEIVENARFQPNRVGPDTVVLSLDSETGQIYRRH
jgi:hypothetical protein